jgi:ribosomal protein S2
MTLSREEKEILVQPEGVSAGGDFQINSDEMTKCGVHFGHRTSGSHPKMKPYISGVRNNVNIIDLDKTAERLEAALKFIQDLVSQNKF